MKKVKKYLFTNNVGMFALLILTVVIFGSFNRSFFKIVNLVQSVEKRRSAGTYIVDRCADHAGVRCF